MRPTRDRPTTGAGLLVFAVLAAGAAGLTEGPRPVDAAEPGPTAAPAATPPAAVDCSRGDNLGFDTPAVTTVRSKSEAEVAPWKTTHSTGQIGLAPNADISPSLDGTQYAAIRQETLSQSFPTLQGDVIAWTVHHKPDNAKYRVDVLFGAAGSPQKQLTMTGPTGRAWMKHHGFYTVAHGGVGTSLSETVLSLEAVANETSHVNAVKLNVWCSVSVEARVAGLTDSDKSGTVTAGDVIRFAYEARNTAAKVEDAAEPEKNNRGAGSLTNVTVAHDPDGHDLTGVTPNCPEAKKTLLKPADPDSEDDEMTCTADYTLKSTDVTRGTVSAAATVKADGAVKAEKRKTKASEAPTVQAQATATVDLAPSFTVADKGTTLDKTAKKPTGRVDEGDTVSYRFLVTNTGNTALESIKVKDPVGGTVECPGTPLAPQASTACVVTVSLTQPDIDAGSWSTNATITATSYGLSAHGLSAYGLSASRSHSASAALEAGASMTFDKAKTAPSGKVAAGGKVSYSFAVTNTGNVTLSEVSVADPKVGKVTCPQTRVGPGKKTTCAATYVATSADIAAGVISNKAAVTVKAPDKKTLTADDSVSFDPDTGTTTAGRHAGPERFATAVEISKATFAPGVDAVYVATGVNFPDALAGSAASGGDGPILLVTKDAIGGATLTELKRLKPKKIIVLGGPGVVSAAVESTLQKEATTTRQSGSDRYSTAAAISAQHFQPGADVAFVATGEDFPDALTGGPAAAKLGGPILLTQKTKLPSATVSELKRLKPKRIVVVGGTGVVSEAVEKALASYTTGKVSRLAGSDRYSTGGEISKDAFKAGVSVAYVATGLNFPDALAGGAAGALKDGPVLLVAGATIPKATAAELTRLKPKSIIVLGGTAVVPKTVQTALGAYLPKTP